METENPLRTLCLYARENSGYTEILNSLINTDSSAIPAQLPATQAMQEIWVFVNRFFLRELSAIDRLHANQSAQDRRLQAAQRTLNYLIQLSEKSQPTP